MSAHTPGPLVVINRGPSRQHFEIHQASKKVKTIPLAYVMKLNDGEGNANLYAASPDLLEVLEHLRPKIQCYQAQTQAAPRKHCPCVNCNDAKAADAVIAKAKGAK